jgi:hypothetical protein
MGSHWGVGRLFFLAGFGLLCMIAGMVAWPAANAVLQGAGLPGAKYTADSFLRVARQQPHLLFKPAPPDSDKEFDTYRRTQQVFVKSRFVLLAALRKPEVAKLPSVQEKQRQGDPVRWLGELVKVEFPNDAEIMSVSVTTGDPGEAAALAAAVVDAYMIEVVNAERDQMRQRLSEVDRIYVAKETELRAKKSTFRQLAEQLGQSIPAKKNGDSPKPVSIDLEMMAADIRVLEEALHDMALERERLKVEVRAPSRVTLLQRAEVPEERD